MLKYYKPTEKVILKNGFKVSLKDNGIVTVEWNEGITIVTLDHLIELKTSLKKIGEGKKLPLLLIFNKEFIELSKEGREYISTNVSSEYTLANAIVLNNLAKRLLFNIVLKVSKPPVPTKSFSAIEDAEEWLLARNKEYLASLDSYSLN